MAVQDFFTWGAGGQKLTPGELARRREIEDSLLAKGPDFSPVGDWTQGLARVANAAAGAYRRNRLGKAEGEVANVNKGLIANLLAGGSGATSPASSSAIPMSGAAGEISTTSPGTIGNVDPSIRDGIVQTASALGIDPVDLATAISYETAGTFDPTKSGPTTQWGQHRGLIQFGEPQAKEYGVNWEDPIGSQLGENGAVANYLRATGVQPGMGLMDIYSAINAGGVGRYGASDANNGGAPGTVADKVNNQMAGHRAKALALLGTGQPADAAQAIEAVAPESSGEIAMQPASSVQPVQVAGGGDRVPMAASSTGINPAIIEALTNPQASEQTQRIAGILLQQDQARQNAALDEQNWRARQAYEQELQANDPVRKLQLEKGQLEIDALRNPKPEFRQLTTEEIQARGLDPKKQYQLARDGKVSQIGDSGTNVTVNTGEGDKFYENLDKKNAEMFSALSEEGVRGRGKLAQINRLQGLLSAAPQGGLAALKQAAGEYGINTEGLSDIQSAQALINELVPQQRQPGSGPMSDADLALFKQSLPRIINQPGGNETIVNTMRGITEYQVRMGEIADAVADRSMTPTQGREAIRNLKNPLEDYTKLIRGIENDEQDQGWREISPGVRVRKID